MLVLSKAARRRIVERRHIRYYYYYYNTFLRRRVHHCCDFDFGFGVGIRSLPAKSRRLTMELSTDSYCTEFTMEIDGGQTSRRAK